MLKKIKIHLQRSEQSWNTAFKHSFIRLIGTSKNVAKLSDSTLEIKAESLFPVTQISFDAATTFVNFEDDSGINKRFQAEGLIFGFNINEIEEGKKATKTFQVLEDDIGQYCKVEGRSDEPAYQLTMDQLLQRFAGTITEVNHTGINFSPAAIPSANYMELKKHIAANCYLVNYPTGEEWPFIIPSSEEELKTNITDFSKIRHPLFELVYSEYNSIPVIQFDIRPNLTKEEVFRLLPEPYGISFTGLENSIRTVYVLSDQQGLLIRFDIGLRSESTNSFYPWMIKEGGRVS